MRILRDRQVSIRAIAYVQVNGVGLQGSPWAVNIEPSAWMVEVRV